MESAALLKLAQSALSAAARWFGSDADFILRPTLAQRLTRTLLGQPSGALVLQRHLEQALTQWARSNRVSDDALIEGTQALTAALGDLGSPGRAALDSTSQREEFLAALDRFSPPVWLSADGAREVFQYGIGVTTQFLRENLADSDRSAPRVAARLLEDVGRLERRLEQTGKETASSLATLRDQLVDLAGEPLDPELDFTAIANALSSPRMSRYRELMGDDQGAMRLYAWNIELSAELYRTLHLVEVVMRNAMDMELRRYNMANVQSADWTASPAPLVQKVMSYSIDQARSRAEAARRQKTLKPDRKPLCHDDYVAQMSFSAWRNALPYKRNAATQRKLWHECLRAAFPGAAPEDGQEAAEHVSRLLRTRNRIAHLEPVLDRRRTHKDQASIGWVLDSVSADARMFYESTHQFRAILRRKPVAL